MKFIRQACEPRSEVLQSDLQDSIFAADFGHVLEGPGGVAAEVYKDPEKFFRNTYPTTTLKKIVTTIFGRLADASEAGAALRLSTGFGGGKTHTLIALWHLGNHVQNLTLGTELLPAAGRPGEVVVAGIDAGKFGVPVCATHGSTQTRSLWGELAYQLGGEAAYQAIQAVDDASSLPDSKTVRAMLPEKPLLILLDELVIYMGALPQQAQNTLLSFVNMLITEVGARKQAILVITDPAGQPVYLKEATALADATKQIEAANRMDDVLGRKLTHFDPIGSEAARVITRRLFDSVDGHAAQQASAEYYQTYQRIAGDHPELLPPEANKLDYAQLIVECYPFHPRMLETAQERLRAMADFNLSRGTLRLFARMLRDIWERQLDLPLITAGDVDWSSERIQADLLNRLNRDGFKAAVDSDVLRHARQLDQNYATDIHRRAAAALMLESLPATTNAAMDRRDLTLAVLRPSEVGHEAAEAMDRLMSVCWHTYPCEGGRYQFRYEPNINKLIEERAEKINVEDAKLKVLTLLQNYFSGYTFQLRPWPDHPQAVADNAKLKLVLCDNEALAQAVCDYEDDANPEIKPPRRFRNAILAVAPTPELFTNAVLEMRRLMAAEKISDEEQPEKKGDKKKKSLLREQLDDLLLPQYRRRAYFQAYRAFNRVVLQGRPPMILEEKYLVPDENALGTVSGQAKIKEFLDDKKLVYQAGDAIDVNLLMGLVKGATPSLEHAGAFSASSVHERALASDRLRLFNSDEPLRQSILEAIKQGLLALCQPNGDAYDKDGMVTGSIGSRKRFPDKTPFSLALNDDVFLAPAAAGCVATWLAEDKEIPAEDLLTIEYAAEQKGTQPGKISDALDAGLLHSTMHNAVRKVIIDHAFHAWQPGVAASVIATTWDQALEYAIKRPLLELKLVAGSANAAGALLACAQPFNAQALTLNLMLGGDLKEGGKINISLSKVKHSNALKPIELVQKLSRATNDYGTIFKAEMELDFGDTPCADAAIRFEQARQKAPEGLTPYAKFGMETV